MRLHACMEHLRACTDAYGLACIHTYVRTYLHACMHAYYVVRGNVGKYVCLTCMHAYDVVRGNMGKYVRAYMHPCIRSYMHASLHICVCTDGRTCKHGYTHARGREHAREHGTDLQRSHDLLQSLLSIVGPSTDLFFFLFRSMPTASGGRTDVEAAA